MRRDVLSVGADIKYLSQGPQGGGREGGAWEVLKTMKGVPESHCRGPGIPL